MKSIPKTRNAGFASRITSAFSNGVFELSRRDAPKPGWSGMPEVYVADDLRAHGAGDVDVRLFITFTAAMDRARDADRLWTDSGKLFLVDKTVFLPDKVAGYSLEELTGILRPHKVSQRHSIDGKAWLRIASSIRKVADRHPVRRVIYDGVGDVAQLLKAIAENGPSGSPLFPLVRGPKVGPMWVRMQAYPGLANISSLDVLPVSVDVQVRKVSEYLGMVDTLDQPIEKVRGLIQRTWAEDIRRSGAKGPGILADTAAALDPALWFFGKWGCTHCEREGRKLPISDICVNCRFTPGIDRRLGASKICR